MSIKTCVAFAALATIASAARADEATIRQVAQQVCLGDVMSLCAAYVPDETRIMACMAQRRRELSAPCRRVFDAGMRSRGAAQ